MSQDRSQNIETANHNFDENYKVDFNDHLMVGPVQVALIASARNLGVYLDGDMTLTLHVTLTWLVDGTAGTNTAVLHFRILYTLSHVLSLFLISHFVRRNFCTFAFSHFRKLYLPSHWSYLAYTSRTPFAV